MKGVTFIIILSVVWSIVSSIIEKRKAAAKKEAGRLELSGQSPAQSQQPVSVKVQSLRRRKKAEPIPAPVSKKSQGLKPIVDLHKKECPLPPRQARRSRPSTSKQIAALLSNRRNVRTAIVLAEILDKPISQR
ncbi:MAG: hypothetical protein H8E86_03625 [Planctomycetes bacterium]|nr:hypothetical protein [Planctomycetota bacterium]